MITLAARPDPVDVALDQSALVVVDMQNAFASKGGMLDLAGHDISAAAAVVDINKKIIAAAREAGVKIVYLQVGYKPDLSDAGGPLSPNYHKELSLRTMRERPELDGKLLIHGTWDWEIVDALKPQPGDLVIRKSRYSGFAGTTLDNDLRARNIRYLFFTGIATNVCVESTARDAYFEEYWPIMVEDAMNHAGPDFVRDATIWNFENVFGWVTDSDNLIGAFRNRTNLS
ncbi:cysteine hydrolase family protein [Hyphococcus sp.]|uniref:cysteine hydrolase family protein n=1 Tax=Hyphococcus sp. TaxID=2038636 RepID=UPI0035C75156